MNVNEAFPQRRQVAGADISVREIVDHLTGNAVALCRYLLPNGRREGAEWRCGSVQGEAGKSLGVHLIGSKAGVWSDFSSGESGDLLDLIQSCLGLDKGGAVQWAKDYLSIGDGAPLPHHPTPTRSQHSEGPRQDNPNRPLALEIWHASQPAENTLAQDYLRGRGITIPIPATVRYHPGLKHADTGLNMPCLVAAVCDVDRKITAIQRIFLTLDGRKAPVNRPKMALGALRGSAVRLTPTTNRVWLTEGIEDGLAVMQMMGEPAWAVLGTSGFKNVELPENIRQVILAPDGDEAGQAVIQEAAIRLAGQGREVRAAKLPAGKDWCDLLDTYEERAGIMEFEFEQYRPEAEALARREAINE